MRTARLLATLLPMLIGGAAATAGPAQAAIAWSGCLAAKYECGTLTLPLDRTGAVPGSVTLSATRRVAPANPSRTAIVAFAGGPGQAAQPYARSFATLLAAGLADKDLLVFDQRGTGKSGELSCSALRGRGTSDELVAGCADQLGARRAFYTSADSVQDLEALRIEGGYEQLVIYGVSYGTKVGLAYAAAYPNRVSSMILDSSVLPEGPDSLRRGSALAVERVIGSDLCAANACRVATPDALGDLRSLTSDLTRGSIRATVFDGSGRRYTARIGVGGLLDLITAGDLNPAIRAELPAAIRSALRGDRQPLLRLSANAVALNNTSRATATARPALQAQEPDDFGDASLYLATLCEENPTFPWTRGAALSQRTQELAAAVRAQPAGTWGIFPADVGLGGFAGVCLGWKPATAAPPAAGALPNVPVLILSGRSDLRTPLEDAQSLAARFPQAQLLPVPRVGHSVLTSETGMCAKDGVSSFLKGTAITPCAEGVPSFAPTARAPRSLADITQARSLPSKPGRTLNALPAALADARRAIIGDIFATGAVPKSVGGLRGGSVRVHSETHWTLRAYEYVPGVRISGTFRARGTSTYRFTGSKAAAGTVTVSKSGRATGRLGGSRVNSKPRGSAASASADALPSFAAALRGAQATAVAR